VRDERRRGSAALGPGSLCGVPAHGAEGAVEPGMVVKKQDLTPAFALEKLAVLVLQPAIVAKDEELRVVGKEPGLLWTTAPCRSLGIPPACGDAFSVPLPNR